MQATRVRLHLGPAIEWAVAAVFLLSTLGVAALIVRELRTAPRAAQPPVTAAPAALPVAVPARAVSVPSLLLADGRQIRVGDTLAQVNAITPWRAAAGRETVDRGSLGERLTRAYEYQGTSFVVVFEPFERAGAPRVAAIYLP
jgi:hypothetical protein